jgi:hypothetical protein
MSRRVRTICVSAAVLSCIWVAWSVPGVAAAAEVADTPPPGHVSATEGTARLEREGDIDDLAVGMALVAGDRVRTDAGRVEITLADGGLLHLDRYSEIDWASDSVVRLGRGRLLVTLRANPSDRVSVEAPGAFVRFDGDGQFRISVGGDETVTVELAVLRGSAEVASEAGAVHLVAGQRSLVRDGGAPSPAEYSNAASPSTLERWADERLSQAFDTAAMSRSYLPSELDPYASSFDRYGTWQVDASYGYVWYPTVAVDWRPYYHGRWKHIRRYGWTWAGYDPWGWPTHHYGRWGLSGAGLWFWVPSRTWGPGWVYWATSPSYVGWCPLGWNGYPVVNVFTYGGPQHIYRGRHPWNAWTVSSVGAFGRGGGNVDRRVLDRVQPSFVMQHVPPGFAPPRSPRTVRAYGGSDAPVRRPGAVTPGGSWGDPARASIGSSSWGDPARATSRSRSSWGDPARNSAIRSYANPRVTDPGLRTVSPYDRAQPYVNRNNYPGVPRAPSGSAFQRAPSAGADNGRSPYGPYAVPRRPTDGRNDDNDGPARSVGARPGMGSRGGDAGPRPGMSAPPDRGQGRGDAAPRGGSGDGGGSRPGAGSAARSGGDGGSRSASPRRP